VGGVLVGGRGVGGVLKDELAVVGEIVFFFWLGGGVLDRCSWLLLDGGFAVDADLWYSGGGFGGIRI